MWSSLFPQPTLTRVCSVISPVQVKAFKSVSLLLGRNQTRLTHIQVTKQGVDRKDSEITKMEFFPFLLLLQNRVVLIRSIYYKSIERILETIHKKEIDNFVLAVIESINSAARDSYNNLKGDL